MYIELSSDYRLKGVQGDFFLLNLDTLQEYAVNDVQAEVLVYCNGINTPKEISNIVGVSLAELSRFLRKMSDFGCLKVNTSKRYNFYVSPKMLNMSSPYLKEIHLDITSMCNLNCLTCYQEPYLGTNITDLNTDQIKQLIDQMKIMNVAKLVISGGEPFLRSDLLDIVKYALSCGIAVPTIFTNATVLETTIIQQLCCLNKNMVLAVSLDGYDEASNDFIRGKGNFKKAINFIELILSTRSSNNRPKLVIDTMVHPLNYDKLQDFFLFLSDLGVERWRVSLSRNQGSYTKNQAVLILDQGKLFDEYERFIKWYLDVGKKDSLLDIQIESFFRTAWTQGRSPQFFTPASCCCEYKKDAITIKPNGDVTACTAFTNLVLGNIKNSSIAELWYSHNMQAIKQMKVASLSECSGCEYLYLCGGGCRFMAFQESGVLNSKDVTACNMYQFFHQRIIPLLRPYLKQF
jgi:radical SAM protein with 4Fe4S-binding SPASM domain